MACKIWWKVCEYWITSSTLDNIINYLRSFLSAHTQLKHSRFCFQPIAFDTIDVNFET